jgi:putative transposase
MPKALSIDLRERIVAAVVKGGLSCRQSAERFDVAASTAVKLVARFKRTGGVQPAKIGGYCKKKIREEHAAWLIARCRRDPEFTISQLVAELWEHRGLKVDRRIVWEFLHAEGLSFKKKPVRKGAGPARRQKAA